MRRSIITIPVRRFGESAAAEAQEFVAVEEPLQIRLDDRDLAITMRTPGHDRELAAGFLFSESFLRHSGQIANIHAKRGIITFALAPDAEVETESLARNFYVTSSCGVCGKTSIDALKATGCHSMPKGQPVIDANILLSLSDKLRGTQAVFERTGGLHAAGLFNAQGELLGAREDVGRHNAVDKLIGAAFLENRLPLSEHILMLSGRASFELTQKALMAGIPVIAAVGAPSSLAVETALRFGMTLIGFLREGRFNVYAGESRIRYTHQETADDNETSHSQSK